MFNLFNNFQFVYWLCRFNEDCKYPHCGYREHQTHFHCMRSDCGYSFCDKTRFVQHTARHERLDTLMGGDFQQFRGTVSCGRPECVYTATLGKHQLVILVEVFYFLILCWLQIKDTMWKQFQFPLHITDMCIYLWELSITWEKVTMFNYSQNPVMEFIIYVNLFCPFL